MIDTAAALAAAEEELERAERTALSLRSAIQTLTLARERLEAFEHRRASVSTNPLVAGFHWLLEGSTPLEQYEARGDTIHHDVDIAMTELACLAGRIVEDEDPAHPPTRNMDENVERARSLTTQRVFAARRRVTEVRGTQRRAAGGAE